MDESPIREWKFLNITEPCQTRHGEFRKCVKRNATRDHRRYERIKLTQAYAKRKVAVRGTREEERNLLPRSDARKASTSVIEVIEGPDVLPCSHQRRSRSDNPFLRSQEKAVGISSRDNGGSQKLDGLELVTQEQGIFCETPQARMQSFKNQPGYPTDVQVNPKSVLGASRVDPFDSCPTNGQADYFFLFHNFILTFAPAFLPIDRGLDQNPVNRLWASHSLSSPVLSNSILHCTSARLDALHHREASRQTLYYRGEAVKHLQCALNDPATMTSDSTIASVAILVAVGNVSGSTDELMLHMTALKRLVSLRGGLGNLGWNRTLGMFISWQDLITSTTTNTSPQLTYETDTPPSISEIVDCEDEYAIPTIVTEMKNRELWGNTYEEIPQILLEIRHLTLVVENFRRSRGATPSEMLSFSKARSSLEYRLLLIRPLVDIEEHGYNYVFESCRIAAMIYINLVLQEFDPAFRVLSKLKDKLMKVFAIADEAEEATLYDSEASLLLWALFMGGLVSESDYQRSWFARKIAKQTMVLHLRTWEDVEAHLMKALWIRRMSNLASQALWKEVVHCIEGAGTLNLEIH